MKTVDAFVKEVKAEDPMSAEQHAALNREWASIKASLPQGEQEAAEVKVREVLKA